MAPPVTGDKPLTFIFKKNSNGDWYLYAFKRSKNDAPRIIDEDKQDLSFHQNVWNIKTLQEQVLAATSQKTITVSLLDSTINPYITGAFTKDHDDLFGHVDQPLPSAPPPRSETSDTHEIIRQFMEASQRTNAELLQQLTYNMSQLIGRKDTQRTNVTKFDGTNEEPRTWLLLFEKACENNHWLNDELRISNLKSAFVPGSAADKWYSSRLLDDELLEEESDWVSWKESFLTAFSQNRIQAASKALSWKYQSGPVMDYFYEKQRLLNIGFPDMGPQSFINSVLLGLPPQLQTSALTMDPQDKQSLVQCLQRLPAIPKQQRQEIRSDTNQVNRNDHRMVTRSQGKDKTFQPRDRNTKPSSSKGKVNQVTETNEKKQTQEASVTNAVIHESNSGLDFADFSFNGQTMKVLLDSGSAVNIISQDIVEKNQWKTSKENMTTTGFNNTRTVMNKFVNLNIKGSFEGLPLPEVQVKAFVYPDFQYEFLMSNPTMKTLGIRLTRQDVNTVSTFSKKSITSLIDVKDLFPSLLRTNFKPQHEVPFILKENAKVIQAKPYRLSMTKQQWAQGKILELKSKGYISDSKSDYGSPIVIVSKDNGKDYRLCVDYRELNKETALDPFPFPVIDDVISSLGGCKFFTKIDLKDGFHQIGLTPETRHFSAFVTPFGHFEWNVLPFGWKRSPALFQRHMMVNVLSDLLHDGKVTVYIDDILIGAKDKDECQQKTFKVLQRLDSFGMTINAGKCLFLKKEVTFLGRQVDGFTRTTKEESIEKIRNMKEPIDLHTLRKFLGLAEHFHHQIENFSAIVRPLNHLKKKDVEFVFDKNCQNAFNEIKRIISSNPILCLPDWNLSFELCTDASHLGTGSILYQRDPSLPRKKQLRVIGYQSYTFTSTEINYHTTDKEALAAIKAIKYFRSYLEGREFMLYTDHQALTSLMTMKEPKGRLARYQVFLMSFNIKICHRNGNNLQDADAISRLCLETNPPSVVNLVTQINVNQIPSDADKSLILKRYHDDADSGGHDGWMRTFMKIRKRMQWKGMRQDIKTYVANCHICQVNRFKFHPKHDFLFLQPHSKYPHETLHLDYAELKKKGEGVKKTQSFIVAVDEFSRMTYTKPLNQTSRSLIAWLESLPFFSSIKKIITDNGSSFSSQEFKNWTERNNIKHYFSAPYHPQGNGMAERKIRDIKMYFSYYPNFKYGWKSCLHSATQHQNRSFNSSLGCSPIFKLTGKSAIFPADSEFGISEKNLLEKECPLTDDQVDSKRKQMQDQVNKKKSSVLDIKEGDAFLFQAGYDNKGPRVYGPVTAKKVVMKDDKPKTLIYNENGKDKPIAIKNVVRYRKRPSLTDTLIMSTFLLSCLFMTLTDASIFAKESPILWIQSTSPVIDTIMNVEHKIVFQSYCYEFNWPNLKLVQEIRTDIIQWCLQKVDKALDPLTRVCQDDSLSRNTDQLSRDRRELVTLLAVGIFTLVSNTAITWYFIYTNREATRGLERRLNIIQERNARLRENTEKFVDDTINITEKLEALEQRVNFLSMNLPAITTKISDTSAALETSKNIALQLARKWRKGQLLPDVMFDLLIPTKLPEFHINPSNEWNLPSNAVTEQAIAKNCKIKKETGLLTLNYQIPLRKNNSLIFEALVFTQQRNFTDMNNITQTCLIDWIGPKFVMSETNCTRILPFPSNVIGKFSFTYDTAFPCHNKVDPNQQQYWQRNNESCVPVGEAKILPSQVIVTPDGIFIYCFGQSISLKGNSFPCPNYVFQSPLNQAFRVGSYQYSPDIEIIKHENFSIENHLRINNHLYPHVHQDPILQNLMSIRHNLELEPLFQLRDVLYHPSLWLVVGLIGLVIILLVILYYFCKQPKMFVVNERRKRKRRRQDTSGEDQEEHEMTTRQIIYETGE